MTPQYYQARLTIQAFRTNFDYVVYAEGQNGTESLLLIVVYDSLEFTDEISNSVIKSDRRRKNGRGSAVNRALDGSAYHG